MRARAGVGAQEIARAALRLPFPPAIFEGRAVAPLKVVRQFVGDGAQERGQGAVLPDGSREAGIVADGDANIRGGGKVHRLEKRAVGEAAIHRSQHFPVAQVDAQRQREHILALQPFDKFPTGTLDLGIDAMVGKDENAVAVPKRVRGDIPLPAFGFSMGSCVRLLPHFEQKRRPTM